jgi:Holliday junction DNA helicase RuvA
MIVKLHGVVEEIFDDRLVLNINGICYEILCSTKTIACASIGAGIVLWIAHIIREDTQFLCGFLSYEERLWFREIMNIRGIGAKVTLSIFSALELRDVVAAILAQDPVILTQASGVGKKVAERIIAELKNTKLLKHEIFSSSDNNHIQSNIERDVVEALVALGYDRMDARSAVMNVGSMDFSSTEELLKKALSCINIAKK